MPELDEILSLNEAAEQANLSTARLRQLVDDGRLPAKKIGNSWAILTRDLEALLGKERGSGRPDDRKALEGRLFVDLRGNSPIQLQLAGPIPDVSLWFKADNRSSLQVELDRLIVEVWIGQPIAEGAVLHRVTLPPNQWSEAIRFHQYLFRDQVDWVRQRLTDPGQAAGMSLRVQVSAYFNTPFGTVSVFNSMIERRQGEFPINL